MYSQLQRVKAIRVERWQIHTLPAVFFLSSLWGDVAICTEASDRPIVLLHIPQWVKITEAFASFKRA